MLVQAGIRCCFLGENIESYGRKGFRSSSNAGTIVSAAVWTIERTLNPEMRRDGESGQQEVSRDTYRTNPTQGSCAFFLSCFPFLPRTHPKRRIIQLNSRGWEEEGREVGKRRIGSGMAGWKGSTK